ncbi:MAG TPA: triose-phosphate isomerase [Flavobacteriales bacterium]|nr:triose-phosphate isomerase [Flavobacteriales bacterium]|tara:strand:- start:16155 stop:16907 length:753 start_codon:yes stop_codon:yes gene_type:complete
MSRKNIVAGNWKMNKTLNEAIELTQKINQLHQSPEIELIIIPPFPFLTEVHKEITQNNIKVGAQNCSEHTSGAYTGEVSAKMLASCHAKYVIIGHSERRDYFKETNQQLAEKVNRTIENHLIPIFCVGEKLSERETNKHFEVIEKQLNEGLFHLDNHQINNCIIAYEPVWAIGTGKTASPQQAQEIHAFIRSLLTKKYDEQTANDISILYGGSCKPANAKELFAQNDIDGGLIGGASLVAEDFVQIAESF